MKQTILSTLLVFCISMAQAQQSFSNCKDSYYKSGKISASQCFDKDNRWGEAKVFNTKGEVTYRKELRNVGGHSSVQFTYYDNGGVKKAEWSSAPDGGIQWYRSVAYFAEDGTLQHEDEDSYDRTTQLTVKPGYTTSPTTKTPDKEHPVPTKPAPPTTPTTPTPSPSETMECAAIYASEYWYINKTKYRIKVVSQHFYYKDQQTTTLLMPGDTLKGGDLILAQMYDEPSKYYHFTASTISKKTSYKPTIIPRPELAKEVKVGVKRFYYVVK